MALPRPMNSRSSYRPTVRRSVAALMVRRRGDLGGRGSAPGSFVGRAVHGFCNLERRGLEACVSVADTLQIRTALEAVLQRGEIRAHRIHPLRPEQIRVALERLFGGVDERLGLV